MKRKGIGGLIIFGILLFSVLIGSGVSDAKEKVFTIAQAGEPPTLYPTSKVGDSNPTNNVAQLINEKLIDWDWKKGRAVPVLAESFRHVDELTFEVKIRKNISFTNGEPLDAEAVKYSLEQIWKEPFFGTLTKEWKEIEVVDKYTVRIHSKKPNPVSWGWAMPKMFIYPPKYHQKMGEGYMLQPLGTGPYLLKEWVRGSKIELVANKSYWGEKPKLDRVIWRGIPEASTRVAALETGEVDLISFVPASYADRIKSNKNLVLRTVPGTRGFGVAFDGRKPPFSDKRVRQAANYAIDKDAIIRHILGGYAQKLGGQLLTPAYVGHNPNLKDYPYDPEKAKRLLREAGYPNGFEVTLDYGIGRFAQIDEVCQAVAGQLEKVGIRVKLNAMEHGTFIKGITSGNHSPLYNIGFQGGPEGYDHLEYFSLRGTVLAHIYLNKEYSDVLDKAASAPELEQRKRLIQKALEIANEDPFAIYLYTADSLFAQSKRVRNWEPDPSDLIYVTGVDVAE